MGVIYLLLGLAGFVPAFVPLNESAGAYSGFGYLFGAIPTNFLLQ